MYWEGGLPAVGSSGYAGPRCLVFTLDLVGYGEINNTQPYSGEPALHFVVLAKRYFLMSTSF